MPEYTEQSGAQGILSALDLALDRFPSVYIMGEGVADPSGIFGTTTGLHDKYGDSRVIECPVAENGFTGIAIGSAIMGQRPVVVHQRVEFSLLAMEQIVNNAAKTHYVTEGSHKVPMVIRLVVGRGWGQGPMHSQSLETMFAYVPGLKVVMPATAVDCKGMLLAAIEDDNPVIFLEHRWVHYVKGTVPSGYQKTSLIGPERRLEGNSVTVVASSYMFLEALRAAQVLELEGCKVDLFDLRIARPLNLQTIFDSVNKTGRVVGVDTGWQTLGLGAEIVARVSQNCFKSLKTPPRRLGLPEFPTPSSRSLASSFYPNAEQIAITISQLANVKKTVQEEVCRILLLDRQDRPIDVPNPTFQGPF